MRSRYGATPRVAVLAGKPIRDVTILSDVLHRLQDTSVSIDIHLPKSDDPLPGWLFDADLVVQRGLGLPELTVALPLERAGIPCCNAITPTIAVQNRGLMIRQLADAGLPVPTTVFTATWPELLDHTAGRPVAVKTADGMAGRGVSVLLSPTGLLPDEMPFDGPYVAQDYVRSDRHDYKVYVAGQHVHGLIKR